MSAAPEFFIPGTSWLHRSDPRVKLLLLGLIVVVLLVIQNLWAMSAAVLILSIALRSAAVPAGRIRFLIRALLPIMILMPLVWVIFYPQGQTVVSLGFFNLHVESLARGLTVALRILAMTFAIFALLFTTDTDTLIQGLVRLRMPYSWGLTLSLALRYVPIFAGSYTSIQEAQQARGLEYGSSRGLKRVREMMPVLVPMIIESFRTSQQMAIALEARGYGASGVVRTYYKTIQMRTLDWVLIAAGSTLFAAILFLKVSNGFGNEPVYLF